MHSGVSTRVSPSIRMSAAAASIASYEVPDIRPMTLMKYPLLGSFRHSEKLRSVDECPLVGISSQGTQGDRTDGARCHHEVGRNIEIGRSEEHTSELKSLMRISYAVLCLKNKNSQR